jgi:hypothetical protein
MKKFAVDGGKIPQYAPWGESLSLEIDANVGDGDDGNVKGEDEEAYEGIISVKGGFEGEAMSDGMGVILVS